jgi:hypothetical protein
MLESIKIFFSNKTKLRKIIILFSAFLFLAICVFIVCIFYRAGQNREFKNNFTASSTSEQPAIANPVQCDGCVRRKLDGVYVRPEAANLPPVAVMIDNHPDARPQSGINQANLVYEAEVEGFYTRLMAVFASNDEVVKIGPVRSARPYFVDWAQDLNAVYAHCGGSPEALVKIEQRGIVDLNEFYNGAIFWRSTDRPAPHNIYLSSEKFNKFLSDKNITRADFSAWQFKDDSPLNNSSSSQEILINYQAPDFQVKWIYQPSGNDYVRYYGDQPELTADNKLIIAKNIVIQTVPAVVIDNDLRLKMDDVGRGATTICLDGACQPGSWSKPDASTRTKFSYASGEEVQFNAGTTWVEVIRPGIKIKY